MSLLCQLGEDFNSILRPDSPSLIFSPVAHATAVGLTVDHSFGFVPDRFQHRRKFPIRNFSRLVP